VGLSALLKLAPMAAREGSSREWLLLVAVWLSGARGHILAVGDSHVAFSGDSLSSYCRGQTLFNVGTFATMAHDFASDQADVCNAEAAAQPEGGPPCCRNMSVYGRPGQWENMCRLERYPSVFGENVTSATHIWLNLGNNDWLIAHCNRRETNPDTIVGNIVHAMQSLRQTLPTQPILMTGSCQMRETFPTGCTAENFLPIMTQIYARACATDPLCTYVDSSAACPGGNATTLVPNATETHRDPIHVNPRGYCYIFTQPAVQQALACLPATYDCEHVEVRPYDPSMGAAPTGYGRVRDYQVQHKQRKTQLGSVLAPAP